MKLSEAGLRLIKSFEGYHKRLPNGDCAAYLCPAGVPTIGHGVTEGIKLGMVWTAEQAEAALMRELAKHEAAVLRLVTVDLNQHQFDALVSLSYNIGAGALSRSTLLRHVNAKRWDAAADAFEAWNRGGGRVLPGLVSRRKREAAHFMKPAATPEEPFMPQAVAETVTVSKPTVATSGVAAGATAALTIPAIPVPPDLSSVNAWQTFGTSVADVGAWVIAHPIVAVLCVGWAGAMMFLPRIKGVLWPS